MRPPSCPQRKSGKGVQRERGGGKPFTASKSRRLNRGAPWSHWKGRELLVYRSGVRAFEACWRPWLGAVRLLLLPECSSPLYTYQLLRVHSLAFLGWVGRGGKPKLPGYHCYFIPLKGGCASKETREERALPQGTQPQSTWLCNLRKARPQPLLAPLPDTFVWKTASVTIAMRQVMVS